MGKGGAAFEEGLKKMGLSTEQLKAAGPDHYLELVTQGLTNIQDPAERAAAGAAVLGRGYRDVAANLQDLGKAFALTADIEPWTQKEADEAEAFSMQMKSLEVHTKELSIAIGRDLLPVANAFLEVLKDYAVPAAKFIAFLTGVPQLLHAVAEGFRYASAAWDVFTGHIDQLPAVSGDAARNLQQLKDKLIGVKDPAKELEKVFNDAKLAEIDLTAAAQASIKTHTEEAEANKKHAAEVKKTTDKIHELEAGFFGLRTSVGQTSDLELEFVRRSIAMRSELDKVEQTAHIANFGFKGMADGLEKVGIQVKDLGPDIQHQFVGPVQEAAKVTKSFGEALKGSLGDLPKQLMAAFTGGGGVGGALKAVGAELGGALFGEDGAFAGATKAATKGLSKVFGDTIGGALGAAIPGIGALIGPGLQALWGGIKKLFGGPSQEELQGRATVQAFETQLRGMMTLQQQAEAQGRNWAATTITIRDAFLATGRTAAEAEQVTLRLWDTKNPQAYKGAIDEINAVMNEQAADQQRAKELIDEYGIAIDQLGPKWRAQQLGDEAKSLMNDYRLMVDVLGVQAPQAMTLMAGKMSAFVQQSVQASTEIPANMQPMLQQMADMGLLTDENGNKITDLKDYGVTFAETFGQGVDRIVAKFDELIARLTESADGIKAIPDSKTVDVNYNVHWNVPPMPQPNESVSYGATGGVVGNHGIQYFPTGGVVLPFVPKATDTVPAMLTPGEGVLSTNDMMALGGPGGFRAFRRMLHMGGGGATDSNVLGSILAAQQQQARYMQTQFKNDIARAIRDEVQKARAS